MNCMNVLVDVLSFNVSIFKLALVWNCFFLCCNTLSIPGHQREKKSFICCIKYTNKCCRGAVEVLPLLYGRQRPNSRPESHRKLSFRLVKHYGFRLEKHCKLEQTPHLSNINLVCRLSELQNKKQTYIRGFFFFLPETETLPALLFGTKLSLSTNSRMDNFPHIFSLLHTFVHWYFQPFFFPKEQWLWICYVCAETYWICTHIHITEWVARHQRHCAESAASLESLIGSLCCNGVNCLDLQVTFSVVWTSLLRHWNGHFSRISSEALMYFHRVRFGRGLNKLC